MKITKVETVAGNPAKLYTDDTLTLAFRGMVESTPASLATLISRRSLEEIAKTSEDSNEVSKAERALKLLNS